jgi:hypothetical protein
MRSTSAAAIVMGVAIASCTASNQTDAGTDARDPLDAAPPGDTADSVVVDDAPPAPIPTGLFPDHPRTLSFDYQRPDVGTAVPAADLAAVTDHYLALLERTHWFDYVSSRIHGWPESDPAGHYWYATWWSGTGIHIQGGQRSFLHVDVGAENNGLRTPQLMEGACYAWRLYHNDADQHLVRRLMRGLSSWRLAMQRAPVDPEIGLLARAAYPATIHDDERDILLDYGPNRPGVDGGASYFVHVPGNPAWGDLWVQAQRSKDDMGHIMRGVAALDACDGAFTEAGAQDDLVQVRLLYQQWARRVENDGFKIATYDRNLNVVIPTGQLANYFVAAGIECHAQIAIRLMWRFDPLGARCATPTGVSGDPTTGISNSSMQIVRTHHEAAAALALLSGRVDLARTLLEGLAARLEMILDLYDSGTVPDNAQPSDIVQLMVESANLGVPLTSREVRWLHQQIETAYAGYDTSGPEWHVFDPGAPDGDFVFEPNGPGIDVKDLALLLGTCVAPYRNPNGRPVLDCDRVRAWAR